MNKKLLLMPGDGVGPEVIEQAKRVFEALVSREGLAFEVDEALIGGAAYDASGSPLPFESLSKAREADAILLGAVGGGKWDTLADHALRPERGLLRLRSELALYANLRPATVLPQLVQASSLKKEWVSGCDLLVVRELTGGIYFGTPRGIEGEIGQRRGFNTLVYSESEIERIVRVGCDAALGRGGGLCSVDKANVLECSMLWREVAGKTASQYQGVTLEHMYVDNAAMQLVRDPRQFDVIVTSNMFGDILSDVAAMITGSIGMLPSASLGDGGGLYEPVHGSAPDIAGQDRANPLAAILSVGMMLRHSFQLSQLDDLLQNAVKEVLKTHCTADLNIEGAKVVGCTEMGALVEKAIAKQTMPKAVASNT